MNKALPVLMVLLIAAVCRADETEEERKAKQAELDAACEVAREERLAPERARFVEQCVKKEERPDRAACERFYADYGGRTGKRAPLYYDLPACKKADDYRRSYRRADN